MEHPENYRQQQTPDDHTPVSTTKVNTTQAILSILPYAVPAAGGAILAYKNGFSAILGALAGIVVVIAVYDRMGMIKRA